MGELADRRTQWQDDTWIVPGGVICPVCDRIGKVYARRFGVPMAKSLIWLYHESKDSWVETQAKGSRYTLRTNQWGHMQKFGVTEAKSPDPDSKTKHSGLYRITELGRALIEERVKITEYIFTYNDERVEPHWLSTKEIEDITIRQALNRGGFDFDEIMQAAIGVCHE